MHFFIDVFNHAFCMSLDFLLYMLSDRFHVGNTLISSYDASGPNGLRVFFDSANQALHRVDLVQHHFVTFVSTSPLSDRQMSHSEHCILFPHFCLPFPCMQISSSRFLQLFRSTTSRSLTAPPPSPNHDNHQTFHFLPDCSVGAGVLPLQEEGEKNLFFISFVYCYGATNKAIRTEAEAERWAQTRSNTYHLQEDQCTAVQDMRTSTCQL